MRVEPHHETVQAGEVPHRLRKLENALAGAAVTPEELQERFGTFLEAIRRVLALTPNVYKLWGIHDVEMPDGTRVCLPADAVNAIVPACLDLPGSLWPWNKFKIPIALAKLSGSLGSKCRYCQLHDLCNLNLRGADALLLHLAGRRNERPKEASEAFTASQLAILDVGEALAAIPCELTPDTLDRLLSVYNASWGRRVFTPRQIEQLLWVWFLTGYLNESTGAYGVEVEQTELTAAVAAMADWWEAGQHAPAQPVEEAGDAPEHRPGRDTLTAFLGMLPGAPKLLRCSGKLVVEVPRKPRRMGVWLEARTGYHWPEITGRVLSKPRRAAAAMIGANADPARTVVGVFAKARAGRVYAQTVGNATLARVADRMVEHAWRVEQAQGEEYWRRVAGKHAGADRVDHSAALMDLTGAMVGSPLKVPPHAIARAVGGLTEPQIVEAVHNASVFQACHRLITFLEVAERVRAARKAA